LNVQIAQANEFNRIREIEANELKLSVEEKY